MADCEFSIHVPTQSGGHDLPQEMVDKWVDAAMEFFIERLGGCTVVQGAGAWKDASGCIHREPVHIVSALGSGEPEIINDNKYKLKLLAKNMGRSMGQMCVLTTIKPVSYNFVSPECEGSIPNTINTNKLADLGDLADWLFT